MTLTTHRSPPLSTPTPLPPPQKLPIELMIELAIDLVIELAIELVIDMHLPFVLDVKLSCLSVPNTCDYVMWRQDYLVQCPHHLKRASTST